MGTWTLLLKVVLLLALPVCSWGDGKFYGREAVPPGIPYQRALLLFDGTREALIVQSKYSLDGKHGAAEFGWVVPVPAVPELASLPADSASWLFFVLSAHTGPRVFEMRIWLPLVVAALFAALFLASVAGLIFLPKRSRLFSRLALGSLAGAMAALISFPAIARQMKSGKGPVDVVRAERVGVYDVSVVRSTDAAALLAWLRRHGFRFMEADLPVVERYVRQGWCFVAARVAPDSAQKMHGHDGLADPLVLVFPSRQAVYPLALTGTGGFDTEVLLYVAAHQPLKDDGRLGLHFAGTCPRGHDLFAGVGSSRAVQVLSPLADGCPALMKLKGTLSPARMQTDLVLTPDPNRRDYRERRWVW